MKKYIWTIATLIVAGVTVGVLVSGKDVAKAKKEKMLVSTVTSFPDIPERVNFAGEQVDLTRYDAYERFDRELSGFTYLHSTTGMLIKRANRFFPIIVPILKKNGVPEDFKYLAVIESSLNPRAISGAKAGGMWQIMPATGKEYGLEINDSIDERFHVEKSTEAACRYLKKAYQKYGNWALVAASYNGGMGRISKELSNQDVDTFFDMWLTEETQRYVYRLLAIKQIFSAPYQYGFVLKSDQLYKPITTKVLPIDTTVTSLVNIAKDNNVTYGQLKEFNPWIRGRGIPNKSGKRYELIVPLQEDMYYGKSNPVVYENQWVIDRD
ncbi:MAG: lytic transglycosylase domain-containing protein [Bacteroidales bacterium]